MGTIDIRNLVENPVEIQFADYVTRGDAVKLVRTSSNKENPVWIDDYKGEVVIALCCKEDAENLIKSLQMAVKLGWFDTKSS